jgi:hypothetical protein
MRGLICASYDVDDIKECKFFMELILITMTTRSTSFTKGETSLLLTESLVAALQHPRSVNSSWMEKDLCRFRFSGDEDSVYCIDENGGKMCMSFPAVLDMGGRYGRFDPYFSLRDNESVRFFFFILFFLGRKV